MKPDNTSLLNNIRRLFLGVICFLAMVVSSSIYSQTIIIDGMYLNAPSGLVKNDWHSFKINISDSNSGVDLF